MFMATPLRRGDLGTPLKRGSPRPVGHDSSPMAFLQSSGVDRESAMASSTPAVSSRFSRGLSSLPSSNAGKWRASEPVAAESTNSEFRAHVPEWAEELNALRAENQALKAEMQKLVKTHGLELTKWEEELEKRERVQSKTYQMELELERLSHTVDELKSQLKVSDNSKLELEQQQLMLQNKTEAVRKALVEDADTATHADTATQGDADTATQDQDAFVQIFSAIERYKSEICVLDSANDKRQSDIDSKATIIFNWEVKYKLTVDELTAKLTVDDMTIQELKAEATRVQHAHQAAIDQLKIESSVATAEKAAEHVRQLELKDRALVEVAAEKLQIDAELAEKVELANSGAEALVRHTDETTLKLKALEKVLKDTQAQLALSEETVRQGEESLRQGAEENQLLQQQVQAAAADAALKVQTIAELSARNSRLEEDVGVKEVKLEQQAADIAERAKVFAELSEESSQHERLTVTQATELQQMTDEMSFKEHALTTIASDKMKAQQEAAMREEQKEQQLQHKLGEVKQKEESLAVLAAEKAALEQQVKQTAAEVVHKEQALSGAMTKNSWFQQEVGARDEQLMQQALEAQRKDSALQQLSLEKLQLQKEATEKEEALQVRSAESQHKMFLMLEEITNEKERLEADALAQEKKLGEHEALALCKDEELARMAAKKLKLEHQLASTTEELLRREEVGRQQDLALVEMAAGKMQLQEEATAMEGAHSAELQSKHGELAAMVSDRLKMGEEVAAQAAALAEITAEKDKCNSRLQETESCVAEQDEALRKAESQLREQSREMSVDGARSDQKQKVLDELKSEEQQMRARCDKSSAELQVAHDMKAEADAESLRLRGQLDTLQSNAEAHTQQITDSEVIIADLEATIERLQAELCQYRTTPVDNDPSPTGAAAAAAQERRKKRENEMQRVQMEIDKAGAKHGIKSSL